MQLELLRSKFEKIGARFAVMPPRRYSSLDFALDVGRDRHGEYFEFRIADGADVRCDVLDTRPRERHLLLMSRQEGVKHKYLCGHDARCGRSWRHEGTASLALPLPP